jgi:hypothetical protein
MEELNNTEKLITNCDENDNESISYSELSNISLIFETKKSYKYLKKQDECEKKVILKIINDDNLDLKKHNDYLGRILYHIGEKCYNKNKYNLMKKYYLSAIQFGNITAMVKLGMYYENIDNNKMLKYFAMALNNGYKEISYDIGKYYELIKKYYKISVKDGHVISMYLLAKYYQDIENNYDEMKVYYLLAIQKGLPTVGLKPYKSV